MIRVWIVSLLAVAVLFGAGLAVYVNLQPREPHLPLLVELPDFQLTERTGRAVSLADLRGQVWVANFVFTTCTGPCPLLSSQMQSLQGAVSRMQGVTLVSFTVDPDTDTPPVLSAYADGFGAKPDRWLFLTGQRHPIYDLIRNGFRLGVQGAGEEHGGGHAPMGQILHTLRFALVDKAGRVRAYYDGTDPELNQKVVPAVRRLLREEG